MRHLLTLCLVCLVALVVPFTLTGCPRGAEVPTRDKARAAVLVTAEAVRVMGEVCTKIAGEDQDLILAKTCMKAYDAARISLIGTAGQVDAWDQYADHDNLVCSVTRAMAALEPAISEIEAKGVELPIGVDARRLVYLLGPCRSIDPPPVPPVPEAWNLDGGDR